MTVRGGHARRVTRRTANAHPQPSLRDAPPQTSPRDAHPQPSPRDAAPQPSIGDAPMEVVDAPPQAVLTRTRCRHDIAGGEVTLGDDVGGGSGEGGVGEIGGGDEAGPSCSHKGRGESKAIEPDPDPAKRPVLVLDETYNSFSTPIAPQVMSDIIKGRYDEPWREWTDIPLDVRSRWFQRFLDYFRPETCPKKLQAFRDVWEPSCGKLFRGKLYKARDNAYKKLGLKERKINEACKRVRPDFIRQDLWEKLCDYWMADEFQVKSEAGRRNKTEGKKKLHCCGSRNLAVHAAKMRANSQGSVSTVDVYRATHTRRNGQMIDEFSKEVLERYDDNLQRLQMEASQGEGIRSDSEALCDAESSIAMQDEAWLASVGGPYKGRILGYGPRHRASTSGSQRSSYVKSQVESQRVQELEREARLMRRRQSMFEELLLSLGRRCCGPDFQIPHFPDDDDDDAPGSAAASAPAQPLSAT